MQVQLVLLQSVSYALFHAFEWSSLISFSGGESERERLLLKYFLSL